MLVGHMLSFLSGLYERSGRFYFSNTRRFFGCFACSGTFGAYDEIPFDDNARLRRLCMKVLVYNTEWLRSCLYLADRENLSLLLTQDDSEICLYCGSDNTVLDCYMRVKGWR
jgi:hypothetical protein